MHSTYSDIVMHCIVDLINSFTFLFIHLQFLFSGITSNIINFGNVINK